MRESNSIGIGGTKSHSVAASKGVQVSDRLKEAEHAYIVKISAAMEEHESTGKVCTVKCEECSRPIEITPLGNTAFKISCSCGKYSDTLRGI